MRLIIITFSMILGMSDFNKISQVNYHKNEADKAIKAEDYQKAIDSYKILIDSLQVNEEPLFLNIANAYYHKSDTGSAAYYYSRLVDSDDPEIRSQAYQQLGVINQQQNKLEASLNHFKNALKSNPGNDDARYNYELLKKLMEQQEQQQQDENQDDQEQEQDKEQEQKDQQEQQQNEEQKKQEQEKQQQEKGQEGQNEEEQSEQQQQQGEQDQAEETPEEGEENQKPPTRSEKLEELNLTEEKARMILEAMKNNELQYLQQMQRKATKKPDSDKPDW